MSYGVQQGAALGKMVKFRDGGVLHINHLYDRSLTCILLTGVVVEWMGV